MKFMMLEPHEGRHAIYLSNYLRSVIAKVINIGQEVEGLSKDGSTFSVLLAVSEIQISETKILAGIVSDASDFKEAEQRALAAKEEAEQVNSSKSEFLTHRSHGFRTPPKCHYRIFSSHVGIGFRGARPPEVCRLC